MMLSVLIPTLNRSERLERLLTSLAQQTYPTSLFEILVIDNGSTDRTPEVVKRFEAVLTNLRSLREDRPGLHAGRHAGLKAAQGDILVYADDDVEALPTWLEAVAASFTDPSVVLAGGKNLPRFESQPPEWLLRMWNQGRKKERIVTYLSILDMGHQAREVSPFRIFGCNFAVRKAFLIQAGGFHPDSMPASLLRYRGDGEDHVARCVNASRGLKAFYHPEASVYHAVPSERMTLDYFYLRAYRHGISDSYTHVRSRGGLGTCGTFPSIGETILNEVRLFMGATFRGTMDVTMTIRRGYRDGFRFHQREVRRDPQLLQWVLRENYIDG